MFSALRQGAQVYILEKGETPTLKIGQVVSVGQPKPRYNTTTPNATFGLNPELVVDVDVNVNGDDYKFENLSSTATIATYGKAVISDNRDAMLQEVDNMRNSSQQIIDSLDYHKGVVDACGEMFKQLNPNYAKEQQRDDDISRLKSEMGELKGDVAQILKILSKGGKS